MHTVPKNRKAYAMGGATDALSVAPTANYSGRTMIQDMSTAATTLFDRKKKNKQSKTAKKCTPNQKFRDKCFIKN